MKIAEEPMKNILLITTLLINIFGMVQAAYALDFIFATAFLAAIFGIIIMMLNDDDDQDKPDPPNANQSSDKPELPDEDKSSDKTDIPKIHESLESGS